MFDGVFLSHSENVIVIDDDLKEIIFHPGHGRKIRKIEALQVANVFYIFGETIDEFLWENRKVKVSKPKVNRISVKSRAIFDCISFQIF